MRIAIVLGSLRKAGTETQFVRLAKELQDHGNDVHLVVLRENEENSSPLDASGVTTHILGITDGIFGLAGLGKSLTFIRNLRSLKPEIVIAALPNTTTYALTLTQLFLPRAIRIAAIRGVNLQRNPLILRAYSHTLRHAHKVICNAPHLRVQSIEKFELEPDSVVVIPNGVDIPIKPIRTAWPPKSCVTVANFLPYKGHADLIQALTLVDDPVELVFCGTGGIQVELENLAVKLGVRDQVKFVNNADVDLELRKADFMVHPSTTEGLSNAILEGLAYGLPVIACDIPGNATLVKDGTNGILVEVSSPQSLGNAINTLTSNRNDFLAQAIAAGERAKNYSWEICLLEYLKIFRIFKKDEIGADDSRTPN